VAREAAALGCRAAAISQYVTKNAEVDWAVTRHHAARVIRVLMDTDLTTPSAWFWNVNLPHPLTLDDQPELRFRDLDPSPHRFTYRREGDALIFEGDFHGRPRLSGRDIDCCMGGMVSVTRMVIGTAEVRCP
jgi:5'-nucleotidase